MLAEEIAQWRKRAAGGGQELRFGVEWIARHAGEGSADARYMLAVLTASGIGVPQDLKTALDHLSQAAQAGHPRAQRELAALVGNWTLIDKIAAGKLPPAGSWQHLRSAVDLAAWLEIPAGQALSPDPRIATARRYLSAPLCEWLIRSGQPRLGRATIYDADSGALRSDERRTNTAAYYDLEVIDVVVAFIRARVSALANVSISGLETSQLLHYRVGEEFAVHCDYLDPNNAGHARDIAATGQRALTVLVYLNDDYEGGDTTFPDIGRSFKGRKGDLLVFWNLKPDGTPDGRTRHVGTAPTRGEKWLFSQWIRIPATQSTA
ncbi:MAG TPA: 2OG-Fe(II) oxygenase [Burkholderiales bacterium]|nr:2OG-Fe(II) oxygenase [Burkholderiales bacterium]